MQYAVGFFVRPLLFGVTVRVDALLPVECVAVYLNPELNMEAWVYGGNSG
jgi:hypothetical protein